jgi:hypothetical protein
MYTNGLKVISTNRLNEMLRDINSNMNNIDLDSINIPQLHTDGMRPNQFKTFYSLHGSTLFHPVLSLNAKLSSLCFTPDALYSIQNHTTKIFDSRYQRISYIVDLLDRDVFSAGELCQTAKRTNSITSTLFDFDDDDLDNYSSAPTPRNHTPSSTRHSSKFSATSSRYQGDSEPRTSGKRHQEFSTHESVSGEFIRNIKGGLRSIISRGASKVSDSSLS